MSRGLAYDSAEGQAYAAAITSIMTAEAYRQSAIVARDHGGPFAEYRKNEEPFLRVIQKHRDAAHGIPDKQSVPTDMHRASRDIWDETLALGKAHGYRNAQTTLLAPTGTIAFMMDCDTTGIEPDIALVKYKKLVGEGFLKIVNQTVPAALRKLGYTPEQVDSIVAYINERETIEGAPELKPEHLSVFDCAFKPMNGTRSIHYMGHLRMMSAVQPFLSGAISKTVNMPEAATPDEIETVYLEGWRMGLKAIAIYRDNSKRTQPLSTGKKKDKEVGRGGASRSLGTVRAEAVPTPPPGRASRGHAQVRHRRPRGLHHRRPLRRRPAGRDLPQDGQGRLHDQRPDGHLRHHGQRRPPVRRAAPRPGPQVRPRPLRAVGLHLQPGDPDRQVDHRLHLPLARLTLPAAGRPSDPRSGRPVGDRRIRRCSRSTSVSAGPPEPAAPGPQGVPSLTPRSRLHRRVAPRPWQVQGKRRQQRRPQESGHLDTPRSSASPATTGTNGNGNGHANGGNGARVTLGSLGIGKAQVTFTSQADAPSCADCGSIMVRNGSCYKCLNCGSTSGCS